MCDYSLEMYGSRPAREGELYVTTRFPSGSIGFAAPGDPRVPVCVQCDTKVVLTDIPAALQATYGVGPEVETIFAQRETGLYRDGMRLKDGRFVSVGSQEFGRGRKARRTQAQGSPVRRRHIGPATSRRLHTGSLPRPSPTEGRHRKTRVPPGLRQPPPGRPAPC